MVRRSLQHFSNEAGATVQSVDEPKVEARVVRWSLAPCLQVSGRRRMKRFSNAVVESVQIAADVEVVTSAADQAASCWQGVRVGLLHFAIFFEHLPPPNFASYAQVAHPASIAPQASWLVARAARARAALQ
jgi:hypothetical protein